MSAGAEAAARKQEIVRPTLNQRESQSAAAHRSSARLLAHSKGTAISPGLLVGKIFLIFTAEIVESSVFPGVVHSKEQRLYILHNLLMHYLSTQ